MNSISKTLKLETERLLLRIPTLEDIPTIFSATRYKGFNDGMLWNPPENEAACIEPYYNGIKAWESGRGYGFSIDDKVKNVFMGRISIRKEKEADSWSIGFWMHPMYQGKGYTSEAVKAIIAFGFNQLQAKRIEAAYALWNKASEKVLKKNGFVFREFLEKGFQKNGVWVAENLMGIDYVEWQNLPDTHN